MKESLLQQKQKNNSVRCLVCQRQCLIAPGKTGFCLTRLNQKGKLYALNFGLLSGPLQVDPIEKKPFYHVNPGAKVPSIGSFGCNFRCQQCLNHWCSWGQPATPILENLAQEKTKAKTTNPRIKAGVTASPEQVIAQIKKAGYQAIAFTYNEPVIWLEFVLKTAKLAKKEGFLTLLVTNGSWTKETIGLLAPFIDAANIDFKGFSDKTYQAQGAFFGQIPAMTVYAQKKGIFLELTTLLIPTVNDNPAELKRMTSWIAKNLGPDTPWHLSQFDPLASPGPAFQRLPFTPLEDLKKAAQIGSQAGLNHIYIWAPADQFAQSDTVCPKCKKILIKRDLWQAKEIKITPKGNCSFCNYKLNLFLT